MSGKIALFRHRITQLARFRPYDTSTPKGRALERQRRAALTIVANFAARIASFAVITLASRLALENMGVVHFGIWMTIASFIALITFLDFGIGNGLIGPIARLDQHANSPEQTRLITMGIAATSLIGIISGIILTIVVTNIPLAWIFRGITNSDIPETRTALLAFVMLLSISLPLQTVNRVFVGMQRSYITHCLSVFVSVVMAIVLIFTRSWDLSIVDYVFVTFGSLQLPGLLSAALLVFEGKIRLNALWGTRVRDYRSLFTVGLSFLALQVGALLGWGSDQVLVSAIIGPADAGVYAIVVRIFMLASIPLYIANAPLWAVYANAIERGDLDEVRSYLRRSLTATLIGAVIMCAFIVATGPLIWDVFSGGYIPYPMMLTIAFALWTVIDCTANSLAMFLNGAHIIRPQLITVIVFSTLAVPTKIWAAQHYGIVAIPIITIALYLATLAVVYSLFLKTAIYKKLKMV